MQAADNPTHLVVNLYNSHAFDGTDAGGDEPQGEHTPLANSDSNVTESTKSTRSYSITLTDPENQQLSMTATAENDENPNNTNTDENNPENQFAVAVLPTKPQQKHSSPKPVTIFALQREFRDKFTGLHVISQLPALCHLKAFNMAYALGNIFRNADEDNLLRTVEDYQTAIKVIDISTRGLVHLSGKDHTLNETKKVTGLDKERIQIAIDIINGMDEADTFEQSLQDCLNLSEQIDGNTNFGQIVKGALWIFAGAIVMGLTITLAIASHGFSSPLAMHGITIGAGLMEAGLSLGAAALAGVFGYLGYTDVTTGQQHGHSKNVFNFWNSLISSKEMLDQEMKEQNQRYVDDVIKPK